MSASRQSRRTAPPKRAPSTFQNLGLSLVALCVALGLGELIVRGFEIGPNTNVVYKRNFRLSENPALHYELVPGSSDGKFRISSAGLT
jgi:hypothetical protein